MSSLLPEFLNLLRRQQVGDIAAVINRKNIAARKVLDRSGFSYDSLFDEYQDIYQFSGERSAVAWSPAFSR
ncbi:hypothetical protein ACRQ5D_33945 [Mucilaginibacter sp. P25]|uniref:hypothetical protein n=1 Tax=Mucilaginibacter sp. P25 TaxID=3423945 RepID=UPI003D7B340E